MSISVGDKTISDGYKATYAASWAAFTPDTTAGRMLSLTGSATKTIKVLRVGFSATQATGGMVNVGVGLDTILSGGVSVSPTGIVPFDSTSPAATATPLTYTTKPSSVGTFTYYQFHKVLIPSVTGTTGAQDEIIFNFSKTPSKAIILSGTSQILVLIVPSGTLSSVTLWIEWTEE